MSKFYKMEVWMGDSQATKVMALLQDADAIGVTVEQEDCGAMGLGDSVLIEDVSPAEVIEWLKPSKTAIRRIGIWGPDYGAAPLGDKLFQLADQIIALPQTMGGKGYDPVRMTDLMTHHGLVCKVVNSSSAGSSEGWDIWFDVEDNGNFHLLVEQLQGLAKGGKCHVGVASTPF